MRYAKNISCNADDFPNVLTLAERYNVKRLSVRGLKPDSMNQLTTFPSKEQMIALRDTIRAYKGAVAIPVDTCYSPMLALINDTKLFGNLNLGPEKGCMAGRDGFSVNVDGRLSPCRHLDYFEDFARLEDYWNTSRILQRIRDVESQKKSRVIHVIIAIIVDTVWQSAVK